MILEKERRGNFATNSLMSCRTSGSLKVRSRVGAPSSMTSQTVVLVKKTPVGTHRFTSAQKSGTW